MGANGTTIGKMTARRIAAGVLGLAVAGPAAAAQGVYPQMAPLEQYRSADEAALARSAAPPSISKDATVLVLGAHGYETAAKGANGFVCLVERAWSNDFASPDFWNPKARSPFCYNAAAARSVLPEYLTRTEWVLAGADKAQLLARTRAAVAAHRIKAPEPGAMCYMMSKDGYLGDDSGGAWRPHLMFFTPRLPAAAMGAGLPGVPMFSADGGVLPETTFMVPVATWSDGTPATPMKM
jgi:hypothetical protein